MPAPNALSKQFYTGPQANTANNPGVAYWNKRLPIEQAWANEFEAMKAKGLDPHGPEIQGRVGEINKQIAALGPVGDYGPNYHPEAPANQNPNAAGLANWQKWANANPDMLAKKNPIPGAVSPAAPVTKQAGSTPAAGGFTQGTQGQFTVNGGAPTAGGGGLMPSQRGGMVGRSVAGGPTPGAPGGNGNFPTNWNSSGNPNLGGPGEGFTTPSGAKFEASPLYQWQKMAGEKALNRQLQARGRYNSSFGINALSDFYNKLAAQEAETYYNRMFGQQQLGQQAALEAARLAAQQQAQQTGLYSDFGRYLAGGSQDLGNALARNAWAYADPAMQLYLQQGGVNGQLASGLGNAPANILGLYKNWQTAQGMNPPAPYEGGVPGNALPGGNPGDFGGEAGPYWNPVWNE